VNTIDQNAAPPLGSAPDWTIDQGWSSYGDDEHRRWTALYERQMEILPGRACDAFMQGLDRLDLHGAGIPDFKRLNEGLSALTGWTIVAVPGLVPDAVFFDHLANRRFPAGNFIRTQEQFDYISEPDVFHDVFGHVPLLADPVFGDYMQAYGKGGLRALGLHSLDELARLYWYTVEFGLMNTSAGVRIYGAGILSSPGESVFALSDPKPNRLGFDLTRVMRTLYKIDDFQETYFVIDSFAQLFEATQQDFGPIYEGLVGLPVLGTRDVIEGDMIVGSAQH
jgi:phenylalanine-4-hydroxylase